MLSSVGYLSDQSVSAVPAESPLKPLCSPVPSLLGSYKELLVYASTAQQ